MNSPSTIVPAKPLNTAVLFLVFNRLDTTKQVFEEIKAAMPPRFYIACDGARENKEGESESVDEIRNYILDNIDWPCDVKTLFRPKNLGCKIAVSSAIDWFFEHEEMGIILEDDCLPSQSFFGYCEQLLTMYRDDQRIFLISGYNKQNQWNNGEDYFFSSFGGIWGWASWRRAWANYDVEMSDIEAFIARDGFTNLLGKNTGAIRKRQIMSVVNDDINTWDYQWAYTRHKNNALACVPRVSLIENIGFGKDATHTFGENVDNVKIQELSLPLKENHFIIPERKYDVLFLGIKPFYIRVLNKLKRILS
jgi:hypothetical protein